MPCFAVVIVLLIHVNMPILISAPAAGQRKTLVTEEARHDILGHWAWAAYACLCHMGQVSTALSYFLCTANFRDVVPVMPTPATPPLRSWTPPLLQMRLTVVEQAMAEEVWPQTTVSRQARRSTLWAQSFTFMMSTQSDPQASANS